MKKLIGIAIFFFLISLCEQGLAQTVVETDSTYIFEMKDGNAYIGKVAFFEENKVYQVETSVGLLTLRQEDIKSIKKITFSDLKGGEYWLPSPHSTRYFLAPVAMVFARVRPIIKMPGYFLIRFPMASLIILQPGSA